MTEEKGLTEKLSSGEKKGIKKKKSTDGLKQTKLNFGKKKDEPKGNFLLLRILLAT